jgi:hypothetical protein
MDSGQVLQGVGLGAFGLAFYLSSRWFVADNARLRRMAESRWRFDRRSESRVRSGEMTQEEWFERFDAGQRLIVKWAFTPFTVLWLGMALFVMLHRLLAA